jgi:phage baseplate assembly protein W|tara:strand:- start:693 stop:1082 length:390 start_codon:yes stop_codon:yes gene_type:complete
MSEKREFSDISLSFDKNPATGDIVKVKDDIAVKQSIKTLVLSEVFEAPFQKGKGTRIRKILFDLIGDDGADLIRKEISEVIQNREPRANLFDVLVEPIPDQNKYSIKIIFAMINTLEPLEVELFVSRVR